jgi:hypothetical protein
MPAASPADPKAIRKWRPDISSTQQMMKVREARRIAANIATLPSYYKGRPKAA